MSEEVEGRNVEEGGEVGEEVKSVGGQETTVTTANEEIVSIYGGSGCICIKMIKRWVFY